MAVFASRPPKLTTLVLLTALSLLSLNMFLPSLPHMAQDFGTDYALVSFSIAGYLAITAFLQLIIGPLSDRYGRRPVILASLGIFVVASIACAIASDIWIFLAFRVLQGAVISGMALSRAVVRDTVGEREAASMLGHISMAMAIAPMLGPLFGGALDEIFGWRANFIAFAVLGSAILSLCWFDLGETNRAPTGSILQQFRMYPELLRSGPFWGYALCGMFSTGAFYAFLAGVPLVATTHFTMSPVVLGLCIGTITVGFFFGSFLSSRHAKNYSLATMMLVGRIVACAALLLGILSFAAGAEHAGFLFGSTAFVGIGNGLTMPSATAGALSVKPVLAGSASGLSGALTVFGGAALTTATGSVVTAGGVHALLGIMLFCSAAGLVCAFCVPKAANVLSLKS
ncbi:multidrug effflux MFS transporter [Rhizobium puerariae]|uniref:Bcr/CflA family efflux transporter n=1 Tax=Rhizobium puerariae TaxID=1585791 RepID=A0ABV6AEB3_9HYPH